MMHINAKLHLAHHLLHYSITPCAAEGAPKGPCDFDEGLRSKFPSFKFKVTKAKAGNADSAASSCQQSAAGWLMGYKTRNPYMSLVLADTFPAHVET